MGEVETVAKQSHPHNVVNQLYFNEKKKKSRYTHTPAEGQLPHQPQLLPYGNGSTVSEFLRQIRILGF